MASVSSGGKPYALLRKLLAESVVSAVLKDSTGAELSPYIKNLDTKLAELSPYIKNLDTKLSIFANALQSVGGDKLLIIISDSGIIVPVEQQSRYKPPAMTLYSGTVTASSSTADIDVSTVSALELLLKVTGVSGTNPTLSVYIEGKFEATGDYKTLVYQENITSTGIWYFTITQLIFRYLRVRWVVGGTSPSFTFGVHAQAMV